LAAADRFEVLSEARKLLKRRGKVRAAFVFHDCDTVNAAMT
jgi:hypothetical protein